MKLKTLQVDGIGPAIFAMRHPLESYAKSDTHKGKVGEKDKELSMKLAKAGPEHAKHLRMIMVWVEIESGLFWWKEFDTYRVGVEKLSCSTMHKMGSRLLLPEDFEGIIKPGEEEPQLTPEMIQVIGWLNTMIEDYKAEEDPVQKRYIWDQIIQLLPTSYIQRRTVMMSYAALRNIINQRKGHKLRQWHQFIDWARTLPEAWMLFDGEEFDV